MHRVALVVVAIIAGCGHDRTGNIDGGVDASTWTGSCNPGSVTLSCIGGVATVARSWAFPASSGSACRLPPPTDLTTTCANGCAIEGDVHFSQVVLLPPSTLTGPPMWGTQPDVLCAGAPARVTGEACAYGTGTCLPTYAELAGDGTVSGQTYLECNAQSRTCTARTPPVITRYLERCDDALIAQYGGTDVTGAVPVPSVTQGMCLLAWDGAAQTMTSGFTLKCIGDWMCPLDSLCDDQIPNLAAGAGATVAVCKPGPRGVIDPGALSP